MWFGTNGGGAVRLNFTGFHHFSTRQGLSSNRIRSITEDRSHNLWLAAEENGGILKIERQQQEKVSSYDLGIPLIHSIISDTNGVFWIGSNDGLFRFVSTPDAHSSSLALYQSENGLTANNIWEVIQDKHQHIWAATLNGLTRIQVQQGQIETTHFTTNEGLINDNLNSIMEDQNW